jgi:hypothetical protein
MPVVYLPDLPARLREVSGCTVGPQYAKLYRWAIAGRLPAKREHGRFFVDSEDLPEIARRLGLKRGEPAIDARLGRPPTRPLPTAA